MKVGIIDSSMRIMENAQYCNTCYLLLKVNDKFDYDCFMQAAKRVLAQLLRSRSYLYKGFWRDYWTNVDEDYDSFFERYDVEKQDDDDLVKVFLHSSKKYLICGKDHPLKYSYFKGNKKGLLVMTLHHTLFDGYSGLKFISIVMEQYKEIMCGHGTDHVAIKMNHKNPLREIAKSYGRIKLIKNLKYMRLDDWAKDTKNVLPYECDFEKEIDRDRLVIKTSSFSRENLKKIKELFPYQNVSLNDIFICCAIKVVDRMNRENNVNNRAVGVGYIVSLRRYICGQSEESFSPFNIFSPQNVIHDTKSGSTYASIMKTVHDIKNIPVGLPFYSMIYLMGLFPIVFVEKMVGGVLDEVNNQLYLGGSVTNLGKVDDFFKGMDDVIEEVTALPAGSKRGFPSICVGEYKKMITFTFAKYHDEEKLVEKMQQYYEDELNKLIDGCNIYEV